jgi:hypothetical protein
MEILEILVVSADVDWVLSSQEKWPSILKTEDNAKQFLIMGVIVYLSRKKATGVKGYRVKSIIIFL